MRADRFILFVRCAILALCWSIAVPLCSANCDKTSELDTSLALAQSPPSIQTLANELQGKKGDEVEAAIIKHFGPAARDVGSGVSIRQWDVESGVLTYSLGSARFQTNGGSVVWLTATDSEALQAITDDTFEMTTPPEPEMKYWLGNLGLKPDSTYEFTDSGQNLDHRAGQTQNFFIKHPHGRFGIHYALGCTDNTVLERLTDGTLLCSLSFLPTNSGPETSYDIVVYSSEKRLAFSKKGRPHLFLMEKGF